MWPERPFRLLSEELPVGRTPIRVILVMEIRSGFVRLVGINMKDFEGQSLKYCRLLCFYSIL